MQRKFSPPTSLAKARAARRARDAGAVMFIVAMTLAIIAAMGMYALNVAATEVKTAGYVRQQAQAYYLSQFGMMAGVQEVFDRRTGTSNQSMAATYVSWARSNGDTNCTSLYGTPNTAGWRSRACYVMHSTPLVGAWPPLAMPASGLVLDPYVTNASETNRGSEGNPVFPDFIVEITDPYTGPLIHSNSGGGGNGAPAYCAMALTLTAMGITQVAPGVYTTQNLLTTRARVSGGLQQCQ